jgi:hypothetical protein
MSDKVSLSSAAQSLEEISDYYKVTLSLLSAIEASLRIDYLNRVYRREKDNLSRIFRKIHQKKGNKASLEEDILSSWKTCHPEYKNIFSDILGALKYRHWLAHGRYWRPKFGRQYDFYSISIIAIRFYQEVPLIN